MLIRTFEYEDFNGEMQKEECCFHMNKAEVIKWMTVNGTATMDQILLDMFKNSKGRDIMDIFDDLIKRSYGKKSADGKRFIKNEEILEDFLASEMYSQLFAELVSDAKKASNFINAIMPADFTQEIEAIMKNNPDGIPDGLRDYLPKDMLAKG